MIVVVMMVVVIVIVIVMIVIMAMVVRVMVSVDADAAHMQVMASLGGTAVGLVAYHLLAIFAQPAVHQIVAR